MRVTATGPGDTGARRNQSKEPVAVVAGGIRLLVGS